MCTIKVIYIYIFEKVICYCEDILKLKCLKVTVNKISISIKYHTRIWSRFDWRNVNLKSIIDKKKHFEIFTIGIVCFVSVLQYFKSEVFKSKFCCKLLLNSDRVLSLLEWATGLVSTIIEVICVRKCVHKNFNSIQIVLIFWCWFLPSYWLQRTNNRVRNKIFF